MVDATGYLRFRQFSNHKQTAGFIEIQTAKKVEYFLY
jgi:hypothetical protein